MVAKIIGFGIGALFIEFVMVIMIYGAIGGVAIAVLGVMAVVNYFKFVGEKAKEGDVAHAYDLVWMLCVPALVALCLAVHNVFNMNTIPEKPLPIIIGIFFAWVAPFIAYGLLRTPARAARIWAVPLIFGFCYIWMWVAFSGAFNQLTAGS